MVKEGDVLCELDSSTLEEKEKQQQILLTQADADLKKSIENVEIQKRQNESDQAAARLAETLANLDLESFEEGESVAEDNRLKGEVLIAREDLAQKIENYEFLKRIAKKGYKTQNDVENARIAVTKAQNTLDVAEGALKVQQKYKNERTLVELKEMASETVRETERVKRQGVAAMAQLKAELEARKLTYEVEKTKLTRLQQQIAACKLTAPQDGEVVYANQSSRRSEPVTIEEGATVRERQKIINLPDLTQMKVDARIHESKISQVRAGLPVIIRIDAVPDVIYHGTVDSVSSVPLAGNWPNLDLKEYEAIVRITDDIEKLSALKPGLTAGLEIIVKQRDADVLQIPVQSVINVGNRYFAYVLTESGPQRRDLQIGDSNEKAIEILDGIQENEKVIMNPRSNFADELNELEASIGKADNDKQAESTPVIKTPITAKPSGGPEAGQPAAGKSGGPGKDNGAGKTKSGGKPRADVGE